MRVGVVRLYVLLAVAACVAYFFVPPDGWAQTGMAVAIGYLGAAGAVVGVRRWRPACPAPWYWFAAGVFLNSTGQLVEAGLQRATHDLALVSLSNYVYYALYPCLITGMMLLGWSRTGLRNWASMVDATTIATGFGLLAWVFVIHPALGRPEVGVGAEIWMLLFPSGDLLMIAMLVRLMIGGGARSASFRLLTASLLVTLAGDITWAILDRLTEEPGPFGNQVMSTIFFVGYLLLGLAALHPTVREVGQRAGPAQPRLNRPLLAALTAASLIAPGVLVLEVIQGKVSDGFAIALGSVALFLLVVTRMSQLLREVEAQARQLRQLARVDELTGLPNRRAWSQELPHAIEQARRDGTLIAVAMIDLDFFKRFNDEYGHQAGDRLLKSAAAAWTGRLRAADQLARYGGEEFIALLPATGAAEACEVIDRLRAATPAGQSFSAGVAVWDGTETSEELIGRADKALYAAKNAGRRRTEVAAEAAVLSRS